MDLLIQKLKEEEKKLEELRNERCKNKYYDYEQQLKNIEERRSLQFKYDEIKKLKEFINSVRTFEMDYAHKAPGKIVENFIYFCNHWMYKDAVEYFIKMQEMANELESSYINNMIEIKELKKKIDEEKPKLNLIRDEISAVEKNIGKTKKELKNHINKIISENIGVSNLFVVKEYDSNSDED